MRVAIHGYARSSAVAVVGTWDPLLGSHVELFRSLVAESRRLERSAVVVMLDPDPVQFLWGPAERPSFDDWQVRAHTMLGIGVDAVARVHFRNRDVDAVAADLFRVLTARIPLAELWLGARQSFGRGPDGAGQAIAAEAERYGFRLVRLSPAKRTAIEGNVIRRFLLAGQLRAASDLVGRPPIRARPRTGWTRIAWPPGEYDAMPLASPLERCLHPPVRVRLTAGARGYSQFEWPVPTAPYLAFMRGPGDEPAAAARWRREGASMAS